jgi:hypothetical protein
VLELMELLFIQFLLIVNRIVYTQNTRLYTQPGRKEGKKGKKEHKKRERYG